MDTSLAEKLRRTTLALLEETAPAYSLRREVLEIKSILQEAGGYSAESAQNISAGETITSSGTAISPAMAAMCLDDFARTVVFIRGVHDAIRDLHKPGRPLRVLYAGCGPLAPLAIPLVTVVGPDEAKFTLIDIHAESVESVNRIVNTLGINESVIAVRNVDATDYTIENGNDPDLMIVEIMRAALEAEPQVAVSSQLVTRFPSAVLLPERVTIDLVLQGALREDASARDRIFVGRIMTLDKAQIESPRADNAIQSEVSFQLPEFDEALLTPMLHTTVHVYGENVLKEYDSGITVPKRLPVAGPVGPGEQLTFRYETGKRPGLLVSRSWTQRSSKVPRGS